MKQIEFTLVRHSAWTVSRNPQFQHAVELQMISTKAQIDKVRKVGGVIIPDGVNPYEYEEGVNYPPEVTGLIPRAPGTFSKSKIEGSEIYIPPTN